MSIIEKLKAILGFASKNGDSDSEMISCEQALDVVQEFLDGELEDVPSAEVKAHFEVCQRCYPYLRLEEAFREAVQRAAADEAAPPELKSRLLEALAEAEE